VEKLYNEQLHNLYISNIMRMKSRRVRWVGHVVHMGEMRSAYKILVRKPERPLGTPLYRWKDNIKMDFKEVACENVDWIHLDQDRVQWQEHGIESLGVTRGSKFCD
jgi:hypothetical protein